MGSDTVNTLGSTTQVHNPGNLFGRASAGSGKAADKDTFFRLLTTQLEHQDPLNPVDNEQFAAQLAQFSTLEQTNNMYSLMLQSVATGYLGKQVSGVDEQTNQPWSGVVQGITWSEGSPTFRVGGRDVHLSDILAVQLPDQTATSAR